MHAKSIFPHKTVTPVRNFFATEVSAGAVLMLAPTVAVVEAPSVVDWLAKALQPWTRFAVLPVFALANAGITVDSASLHQAFHSPVAIGIIVGLVIGKPLGITSFSWFACRIGLCSFPINASWRQFIGVSMIAGIGFTVSLFVANLAFANAGSISLAKTGILIAVVLAGAFGWITLATAKPMVIGNSAQEAHDINAHHTSSGSNAAADVIGSES